MNSRSTIVFTARLRGRDFSFHTTWGLFSPKDIDEGTRLLIDQLKIPEKATVLDLGCGYGPIGIVAAALSPGADVHMVDKDFVAVEYANSNAKRNNFERAHAYLSNGFDQVAPDLKFDAIISNLPAKIGSELLQIFIEDAYSRLKPGGTLYVVTISGLKDYIKRHFQAGFGNYTKLKQSKTYTAASATR